MVFNELIIIDILRKENQLQVSKNTIYVFYHLQMKLKELSTLKADFSEISSDNDFFISNIGQKISLKVDERGTNVSKHNQSKI